MAPTPAKLCGRLTWNLWRINTATFCLEEWVIGTALQQTGANPEHLVSRSTQENRSRAWRLKSLKYVRMETVSSSGAFKDALLWKWNISVCMCVYVWIWWEQVFELDLKHLISVVIAPWTFFLDLFLGLLCSLGCSLLFQGGAHSLSGASLFPWFPPINPPHTNLMR